MAKYTFDLDTELGDKMMAALLRHCIEVQARMILQFVQNDKADSPYAWDDVKDCLEVFAAANRLLSYFNNEHVDLVDALKEAERGV